jgi:hypothetical protein
MPRLPTCKHNALCRLSFKVGVKGAELYPERLRLRRDFLIFFFVSKKRVSLSIFLLGGCKNGYWKTLNLFSQPSVSFRQLPIRFSNCAAKKSVHFGGCISQ